MTPLQTALSPLFLVLVFPVFASVVSAINYPGQKFLLQKKFPDGTIRKVKTYTHIVGREQVESEHGPGRYSLKAMLPRIAVIWKDPPKLSEARNELIDAQPLRLEPLERKTKYLTLGVVGLGIGTAVGLGATAITLLDHGQLLNRATIAIDSFLTSYPIPGFRCSICSTQLVSVFDKFCGLCGHPITAPDRRELASPSEQRCLYCNFPIRQGQLHCRECGRPIQAQPSPPGWSLP